MMNSRMPLTVNEAAKQSRMSVSWWRKQVFEKKIKHMKIGSRVLIPADVFEDLLTSSIIDVRGE